MLKYFSLIIILSFICGFSKTQSETTYEDVLLAKIKSRSGNKNFKTLIEKQFSKSRCANNISTYNVFVLYNFSLERKPTHDEFKSGEFVELLKPMVHPIRKSFIQGFLITEHGNVFSDYIEGRIFCYENKNAYDMYSDLINAFIDSGVNIAFRINNTNGAIYFGIRGDDIYVFELLKDGIKMDTYSEFFEAYPSKLYLTKK